MTELAKLADDVASRIRPDADRSWDELRDLVDGRTDGDLECLQLDILTDMVQARLER